MDTTTDNIFDFYGTIDILLVPLLATTYALTIFGITTAMFSAAAFITLINFFSVTFVSVLFLSLFLADIVVSKRFLRTATTTTRAYVTLALTVIFCIFFITTITGGLEPWQAFLIALVFHIIQARFRTSSLTMAQQTALAERRTIAFDA